MQSCPTSIDDIFFFKLKNTNTSIVLDINLKKIVIHIPSFGLECLNGLLNMNTTKMKKYGRLLAV